MAAKGKGTRPRKAKPRALAGDQELREVVGELALLAAMNNLMAQTAFLTVERLRISSEVVDEAVSNEFGQQLYERCEKLVQAGDDVVLQLLDRVGARDARAQLVREVVQQRRAFREHARSAKPPEQRRLLESLERMYR